MIMPNMHYAELKESYLFYHIAQKTGAYLKAHPGAHLYRLGIGDVSLPLCDAVIRALHEAVDDQALKERFHGYMPECGAPFLREGIAEHYRRRGIEISWICLTAQEAPWSSNRLIRLMWMPILSQGGRSSIWLRGERTVFCRDLVTFPIPVTFRNHVNMPVNVICQDLVIFQAHVKRLRQISYISVRRTILRELSLTVNSFRNGWIMPTPTAR